MADWPEELLARVRAIAAGELEPAAPRDAATVVLVRDAAIPRPDGGRLEVYLLRRVTTMAFAAGMHVFPGGTVDPADAVDPAAERPAGYETWAASFTDGDAARLDRVIGAAIRETAEEAGVALQPVDLRPFAHWCTPEPEPRRYDTRFLLAVLPSGQEARLADGEADRGVWVSPADGLALPMLPPTQTALRALCQTPDTAAALTAPRDLHRILPLFVERAGRLVLEVDGVVTGGPRPRR